MADPFVKITHLINQGLFPRIYSRGDVGDILHSNTLVGLIGGGKLTAKGFSRNLSVAQVPSISGGVYYFNPPNPAVNRFPVAPAGSGGVQPPLAAGSWAWWNVTQDPLGADDFGNTPWSCDVVVPPGKIDQHNRGVFIVGLQCFTSSNPQQPGTPYDEVYFKALLGNFISPVDANYVGAKLIPITGGGPLALTGVGGSSGQLVITSVQAGAIVLGTPRSSLPSIVFPLTPQGILSLIGGGTLTVGGMSTSAATGVYGTGVTYYNTSATSMTAADWNGGNLFGPAVWDSNGADANGWTPWSLSMTVPVPPPSVWNRGVYQVSIQCQTGQGSLTNPNNPNDTTYFNLILAVNRAGVDGQGPNLAQAQFLPFGPQAANV